ncbi:hypothetical protein SAMN04489761_3979 [Tenacibaculum sp. MAR_2009_124]|uniref:hypothetical protein n=1 Tax=Tenacibaculum sp. MAR_2009_124 TaxID=1250059 RepID=UPI000895D0E4|nr:hypothetical protein [Tenacibaculum sp. MAR_2009_124]SEC92401.1 hypothetical protein SAMN04489761_3979 [Tenacibaculum sp. MAR_2009_124]
MTRNYILIIYLLLFQLTNAQSQQYLSKSIDALPTEKIFVHNSNDFLLTGENLYYSIYCLDNLNQLSPYSKIAYIELINNDNQSVLKQSINLIDGSGYGDIFINTDIVTGTYKLAVYTQWMLNKGIVFSKNIFIVNPFSKKLKNSSVENQITANSDTFVNGQNKKGKSFQNNQFIYSKREKVKLNLSEEFSLPDGLYSISVRKKNNFNIPKGNKSLSSVKKEANIYLPELRGSLIQGKVSTNSSSLSVSDIKMSLSSKNLDLPVSAVTNEHGEFFFNIPNLDTKNVSIQIHDDHKDEFEIIVHSKKSIDTNFSYFPQLYLNDSLTKTIKEKNLYSQIENAFFSVKRDSLLSQPDNNLLLDKISKTYLLDDFKRFKTVKETFVEVISGAGFSKTKGKYKLSITNPETYEILKFLSSLVIVDGYLLDNHEDLLNFDARKIKSVSIITDKYFYGNALYQGIAVVETFKKDFSSSLTNRKNIKVTPVQPEKVYFFQDSESLKNQRIPDFRTQLYWDPNIDTSEKEITFFTSDVNGEFEIDLVGYTEQGKFVSLKRTFLVH